MCHDEESHQQVKKEWLRAVYTAETAGKLSDPVPRRKFQGSSVKISEALKEVMKKKKKRGSSIYHIIWQPGATRGSKRNTDSTEHLQLWV